MSCHSHHLFQVVPLFLQCQKNLKIVISQICIYNTNKSQGAERQLLFYLIMTFQKLLMVVRINDTHYVITCHQIKEK